VYFVGFYQIRKFQIQWAIERGKETAIGMQSCILEEKEDKRIKGQGKQKTKGQKQVKSLYLSSHFDVPGAATRIV
jgi:hypothetical protein